MMYEIVIRQISVGRWGWYVKEIDGHEGSPRRLAVKSCQEYYSVPDVAWRHAMTALETEIRICGV